MARSTCLLLACVALLADPALARQAPKGRATPKGPTLKAGPRFTSSVPAGKWMGQDGKDLVGPYSALVPSDVQDIHIALAGLPRDHAIAFAKVLPPGGGEWLYNGSYGPWKAQIEREPGSPNADLYLEPNQDEDGRPFHVELRLDDGRTLEFDVRGGRADANLRMPGVAVVPRWVGQERQDRVGMGPSVGPDGVIDARIALTCLSKGEPINSVELIGGGGHWETGSNPKGWSGAEMIRDEKDKTRADLFFEADRDLAGQSLQVIVRYHNTKVDATKFVAGKFDPKKKMLAPKVPSANVVKLSGRWHGQPPGGANAGDILVSLVGMPAAPVAAAVMTDGMRGVWLFKAAEAPGLEGLEFALPMTLRQGDSGEIDLAFAPFRDETGAKMTLRLILRDGRVVVGEFPGGAADPGLRAGEGPGEAITRAKPGDDLQAMVARQGTIRLTAGKYPLKRPLILEKPVKIVGDAGAVLVFSQDAAEPEWSTAIKIHSGHTTLEDFSVRFASPVRWKGGIDYGAAVIGVTDNADPGPGGFKADVVFRKLDVEGPPASGALAEAPRTMRLHRCVNGKIEQCTVKGGTIEMEGGPWRVADNRFVGTMPGTFSFGVISAHGPHDLVVKDNVVKPSADSGKVWRFLVMTGHGDNDLVEGNAIEGIGPRDNDTVPGMNAPEIILTESYSLHFEGRPLALSPDGRVLVIPPPQGNPVESGDVVAIVSGPNAGQWRRISQVLGPATYLLDEALPAGDASLSIATGFVRETIRKNRIDSRGGTVAGNLILVGNLFGLTVRENHLLGGNAFKITAAPTEHPVHWGWSHAPLLGTVFEGNIIEDSPGGGVLSVEHAEAIKSSRGRVYGTAVVKGNIVRWSGEFLAKNERPAGITLGGAGALDPGELIVTEEGNRVEGAAAPAVKVVAAKVNGKEPRSPDGTAGARSKARKR